MIELLCRLFVKDRLNVNAPEVRRRYGMLVSVIAIIINILLFTSKFIVGRYIALSLAIYADAMNNLADAGSSVISLVSFKIAAKPADRKHPFGHARIEYVTSMLVAFLVLHTAIDIFTESIEKLMSGTGDTEFKLSAVIVLACAILLKLWLCLLNRKVGKKINSSIMRANSADSLSDALSTTGVLAATFVLFFFPKLWFVDAVMGLVVAVIIFISGIRIFNSTKNSILGEAPQNEVIKSIEAVVGKYPEALGIHDMFVHSYGPGRCVVSMHVEVDGAKNIFHTHDMIDNIEKELRDDFGYICTIHMDPIVTDDARTDELREKVEEAVREIDVRLRIHDFRFVEGHTHSNLIFDVAAPFELKLTDDGLISVINERVRLLDGNYYAVVTVDRE